jgi:hypothetical protein
MNSAKVVGTLMQVVAIPFVVYGLLMALNAALSTDPTDGFLALFTLVPGGILLIGGRKFAARQASR